MQDLAKKMHVQQEVLDRIMRLKYRGHWRNKMLS